MAWSTPGTAVTGATATAAFWNQNVRDNLNAGFPNAVSVVSWSPDLEATSGAIDQSVTARYYRVGGIMHVWARFVITEATGTGSLFVTLPTAASGISSSGSGYSGQAIGSFTLRDDGTVANSVAGTVRLSASDEVSFDSGTDGTVAVSSPFALDVNDVLTFWACYPVA